ncbi:hypothetical protein KEM48_006758 [Puccinia striiformis f. sp. tritici PST-130]|nr:hypothetical protein KEM48_006758 [Puccinia striiformis f. sp. tritici PST-130]
MIQQSTAENHQQQHKTSRGSTDDGIEDSENHKPVQLVLQTVHQSTPISSCVRAHQNQQIILDFDQEDQHETSTTTTSQISPRPAHPFVVPITDENYEDVIESELDSVRTVGEAIQIPFARIDYMGNTDLTLTKWLIFKQFRLAHAAVQLAQLTDDKIASSSTSSKTQSTTPKRRK